MDGPSCSICGGDGRIGNSLGRSTATCPACHGSGRAGERSYGFHDVTKTKASHHHPAVAPPKGPKAPVTAQGAQLAAEVAASALPADAKARLVGEIMHHEEKHERCTETFVKKLRKQLKPAQ
jgi:hypothetical protein